MTEAGCCKLAFFNSHTHGWRLLYLIFYALYSLWSFDKSIQPVFNAFQKVCC